MSSPQICGNARSADANRRNIIATTRTVARHGVLFLCCGRTDISAAPRKVLPRSGTEKPNPGTLIPRKKVGKHLVDAEGRLNVYGIEVCNRGRADHVAHEGRAPRQAGRSAESHARETGIAGREEDQCQDQAGEQDHPGTSGNSTRKTHGLTIAHRAEGTIRQPRGGPLAICNGVVLSET